MKQLLKLGGRCLSIVGQQVGLAPQVSWLQTPPQFARGKDF